MVYETRIDRDEKRVRDLCEKLNFLINKITNINPNFIYFGCKEDGCYDISNENKHSDTVKLDLSIRLHYPSKISFTDDKETRSLNDNEFEKYVESKYNQSKLLYAEILWFSVNPTGKGIGSKVVNEMMGVLKYIDSIEFILLEPKNLASREFWIKNKFINTNNSIYRDKRVGWLVSKDMIYSYNNEY